MKGISFSVFTKPWRLSLDELGPFVADLGFDGIELPVRPGYPVEPATVDTLPAAAKVLARSGVKILSVAGPTDAATIRACAKAGVPVVRTMASIPKGVSYLQAVDAQRREYDALLPLLRSSGVTIGVQNHCDRFVANALGLRQLLEGYDPQQVAAVWDAAHEALDGMQPDLALDAIWPQLCMVNLKNAFWKVQTGPEAESARWTHYWTDGRHGLCEWPRVVGELKARGYQGVLCLTAEYSDETSVERLIRSDLAFAQSLFAE
jgi:sugar phosphate isomerase/epimerase